MQHCARHSPGCSTCGTIWVLLAFGVAALSGCSNRCQGHPDPIDYPDWSYDGIDCDGVCIPIESGIPNLESFATDEKNCGDCGNVCTAETVCEGGQCKPCPPGATRCEAFHRVFCIDLASDVQSCGICGHGCGGGEWVCEGGVCKCPAVVCFGRCVDPMTDQFFCGASGDCTGSNMGTQCFPVGVQSCVNGLCVP